LTKGTFRIVAYDSGRLPEPEFKRIIFSMEKYSNHPIAKQITREWKVNNPEKWKKIEEIKGKGIKRPKTLMAILTCWVHIN
jgi:Cu+-exporting ATPase